MALWGLCEVGGKGKGGRGMWMILIFDKVCPWMKRPIGMDDGGGLVWWSGVLLFC